MAEELAVVRIDWPVAGAAAAAWERLRVQAPTDTPFLTPEWLETWWRHLGPTRRQRPSILAVATDSELVLLGALHRAAVGSTGLVALRPLGLGVSDYLDLLLPLEPDRRERCLARLLDGLLARSGGWDVIDLPNLPAASPTVEALDRLARARGLPSAVLDGYRCPYIALTGSWAELLSSRPGRFRYNLRSRLKRLRALGDVVFRTIDRGEGLGEGLAELTRLHARRWADQHTGTIFSSSPRGRAFYAEACRRYAARELLDLTLIEVDGRAIAGSLSFVDRGVWYYYLPAWEPSMAAYAPGSILLAHLIERAYDLGLHRFDFMLGDEPYKTQWADHQRRTVRMVVGSQGPRGRLAVRSVVAWHRLKQRARASDTLQRARRYGVGRVLALLRGGA